MRRSRYLLLACALVALGSCGDTPTEITPLTRAVGEVQGVMLNVDNLAPVDPATQGVYTLWALMERNQTERLGQFAIDSSGDVVDENGTPIERFQSDEFAERKTLRILVTIELAGLDRDSPQGLQVLSGTVIEGVADLTVPISTTITEAGGNLRVFTPTDGPGTNETSGFWAVALDGSPSIDLPDSTGALVFETFVEIDGNLISVGRFESPDEADDRNPFSSEEFPAPERPGEDLLLNAPEGLSFPADLSGARVTISLEDRFSIFRNRSQLIVLEAMLPQNLSPDQIVPFTNRAEETFPTGRVVLF